MTFHDLWGHIHLYEKWVSLIMLAFINSFDKISIFTKKSQNLFQAKDKSNLKWPSVTSEVTKFFLWDKILKKGRHTKICHFISAIWRGIFEYVHCTYMFAKFQRKNSKLLNMFLDEVITPSGKNVTKNSKYLIYNR